MRRNRFWTIALLLALLLAVALGVQPVPVAYAATITVTTTSDELNSDGDCSLREAIQSANMDTPVSGCTAGSGADTITLPAGTYTLTIPGTDEEASGTGDLDITSDLTINGGGGAVSTFIRAGTDSTNGIDRVLDVHAGVTVEINDVAIYYGRTPDIAGEQNGGGIRNQGTLTLNNSLVWLNTANSNGGGIYNNGTLTLNNSSVSYNTANDDGGGIYNGGTLMLDNSSVSFNTAPAGGGISNGGTLTLNNCTVSDNEADSYGGGIDNNATLTLVNSTVRDNDASMHGGGISSGGALTLNNCTVSDNDASEDGGGIQNYSGTLTLVNSTIADNTADNDNNGSGNGGGVAVGASTTANVMNTIIGDNQDMGGGAYSDCSGTLTSQGYNLLENTAGCTFTPTAGDITGADPNLDALADNGGATDTHALLTASPAIEQIPDGTNGCLAGIRTDQRGYVRAGGPGNGGSSCDIGAYEYDTVLAPSTGPVYLPIVMKNY